MSDRRSTVDHLTQMKVRHGVTEPDEKKARAILLAILLEQWLESRAATVTAQQIQPERKEAA
jgi:hypothetical protein